MKKKLIWDLPVIDKKLIGMLHLHLYCEFIDQKEYSNLIYENFGIHPSKVRIKKRFPNKSII